MGLEFCESWQGFEAAAPSEGSNDGSLLLARWTSNANGGFVITSDAYGKYCTPGSNVYLYKTMSHQAGWTVGFRFRISQSGILWSGYNDAISLCSIDVLADNTLRVKTGNANVLVGVSDAAIHTAKWNYLEISVALSGSGNINAAVKVRLNGGLILDANADSGIAASSLVSATATINSHSITGPADYRDLYFNNTANSFRGDIKIVAVRPNGDVVTNFTPTGGGAHYTQVNEEFSDSDTTYVADGTATDQDIYDWQDIPGFSGTIQAVQISFHARKDDEGAKSFEIVTGDTGSEAQSPEFFVADDYICYHTPQDLDPATGLAYTQPGFNAKRFGVRVIS